MMTTRLVIAALASSLVWAEPPAITTLPRPITRAMDRIKPDSLRGHVSFLASDLLEGRNTPSPGLEIAAEYIAAQFRRAGLQPIPSTNSHFQIAKWILRKAAAREANVELITSNDRLSFSGSQLTINKADGLDLAATRVYKVSWSRIAAIEKLPEGALAGFVVLMEPPATRSMEPQERRQALRTLREVADTMKRLRPESVLSWNRESAGDPDGGQQLIDPNSERAQEQRRMRAAAATLHSPSLGRIWADLPEGPTDARLSVHLPRAEEEPVTLRNVVGILPGSDPALKDSYLLITAHYDHIGIGQPDGGDRIYNGANDDASGTSALIEVASAMAALPQRPKRTVVFMAVFGEEKGLLGAKYYARNPIFPLAKTIANVNLEHLGRSDAEDGPQIARLSPTGFEYSELTSVLRDAGKLSGVEIFHHPQNSESFFSRSDNAAFAEAGVPATTVCVAFEFKDYHGAGDHWDKLDYENFAKVTRTILAAAWMLGERSTPVEWNASEEKARKYREARQ